MSGLNVALGTKSSQEAIREMYPSVSLPNPRVNCTVEAVQTDMQKKMTIKDEKASLPASNPPKSGQNEPLALVIAGPSGVGKGTLIEVLTSLYFDLGFLPYDYLILDACAAAQKGIPECVWLQRFTHDTRAATGGGKRNSLSLCREGRHGGRYRAGRVHRAR